MLTVRSAVVLIASSLVVACGFQLRGSGAFPPVVEQLHIRYSVNTRFVKALKLALSQRGVQLAANPGEANAELRVLDDDSGQRILSVAVTDGPEEYEVYQLVTIEFLVDGQAWIEPRTFTLTRDYTYDKNNILGKRHEYESLRDALAVALAETVVRRMRYAQPVATP